MHNISNLFYFGTKPHMFRTVSLSIIRSLRLYIQHQVYVIQVLWLLASKQPQKHVEQSRNNGIINCPTQLHLVSYFYKIYKIRHFILFCITSLSYFVTSTWFVWISYLSFSPVISFAVRFFSYPAVFEHTK